MTGSVNLGTPAGGKVIIQPASSVASDVTVSVPSANCTLGIQGPAFSAYLATNQTASASTWTKVQMAAEDFDTASCYDTSTYRFTPNVAGYYKINARVYTSGSWQALVGVQIYKNGSAYAGAVAGINGATFDGTPETSSVIYMNGTTDYLEVYGYGSSGTPLFIGAAIRYCQFSGFLARAA